MTKLYFQENDDGRCHPLSYFKWLLKYEDLDELTIYEAQRQDVVGFFWCKGYQTDMDKSESECGKGCEKYSPRNGKSGCCRHYSLKFYEPSGKTQTIRR